VALVQTYVKVGGRWSYLYRAIDQHGQVIDVLVSTRRNADAARAFFSRALRVGPAPVQVTTDRAPVHPRVLDEVVRALVTSLSGMRTIAPKLITGG
jgi:transposase, IS6 family